MSDDFMPKIQCPDCGHLFDLFQDNTEHAEEVMLCSHCNKLYTEDEIRRRCGI